MLYLFGLQPFDDNVHIVGSPLYHTAVLVFSGAAIHIGHTLVVMDKWSPQQMLHLIDKYQVTNTHMVPTQFVRLLGVPEEERAKYDVSSLRHMIHAAAPCPPDVKRQMIEWWGPVIDEYYAASEGGGTYVFAEEWLERPGTVGRKWPFSEVVILDDDGNELPPGQIGTVYMHMQTGNFEYFKDKEKTDRSFRGKFFTVGDAGYLDDDGWLFLSDRKIDMIISGGANIYPAEIESELIMHPKVADVAVFGIPHDDWGEEVKAVVEPVEGVDGSPELEVEILAWASDAPRQVQDAQEHRLHRRDAPRPQRQALQAQAARPLLGGPRARHLTMAVPHGQKLRFTAPWVPYSVTHGAMKPRAGGDEWPWHPGAAGSTLGIPDVRRHHAGTAAGQVEARRGDARGRRPGAGPGRSPGADRRRGVVSLRSAFDGRLRTRSVAVVAAVHPGPRERRVGRRVG